MITFIDEKGTEHSALVAYSVTNAVNGELSVKGTIYTNDKVLHGIGRGWRFRLDDEYYRITYAKPNDTGRQIEVEFDAVHQFFYDMSKSMVYTTLNGSKPFETYLQAIFSNSGYTYNLEATVGSIRKENFGNKSRLSLFNDIIKAAGLEFSVRGHVIRILKRVGTDLSTIVRKDFNMNELKIEKDINSFVTYQRGLGAWKDDEDHSKGRYETSYESPLSAIYGRIEADPVVDERYKDTGKLLERLKENVDKSYKVSVEIDMEDLSQAGYRISRPNPGDYIMAINETLGFRQKVRIVSFTSEYDVGGKLISRKVVCNDIGTVQRATSEISHLSRTLTDSIEGSERALQTATKALVSADGKNTNYFGDVKPIDIPKGTLRKGDRLFLTVGDKKQLYFWNGAEWELEPTEFDHEKFDMEFNRNSQEIKKTIQENRQKAIEALRNAGASTLLAQEAKRIGLDSVAKLEELKRQATSAQTALSGDLDTLKRTLANEIRPKQEQVTAEIAKQVEALNRTKNELAGVKSAQATYEETTTRRLAELTNLANGKASKSELTQTAEELASKIASVRVGGRNYYRDSEKVRTSTRFFSFPLHPYFTQENIGETWTLSFDLKINEGGEIRPLHFYHYQTNRFGLKASADITPSKEWQRFTFTGPVIFPNDDPRYSRGEMALYGYGGNNNYSVRRIKLEKGTLATDWSPAPEDTDGLITEAKATFERTAQGLRTDLSAIQTYVDKDGQRQEELKSYARNETITHINIYRQDVARNYILRSRYDEDARSIRQQFEAITNSQNGLIATKIADYKHSVDGKFTDISSQITIYKQDVGGQISGLSNRLTSSEQGTTTQISNLSNRINSNKQGADNQISNLKTQVATNKDTAERQMGRISDQVSANKANADSQFLNVTNQLARKVEITDFQRVKETSQLYERILGNTENGVADKVARMAMTNQLFQVEVGKVAQKGRNYYRDSEKVQTKTRFFSFPLHPYLTQENVGETWTLSFDLKINEGGEIRPLHFYHYQTNRFGIKASGNITPSKEWQRFTFTGPVIFPNDDPRYARGEMALYDYAGNNNYSVRRIKFERGTVATPWSPAPEDTDEAIRTVQSQLAGSWAVQNINSAGDLISGINLGANGHNRFVGKLTHITGETLIDKAVIKDGMIANVSANKLTAGTIDARTVNLVNLNANNVTSGTFRGLTFEGGIIRGNNGNTVINLNDNVTTYNGYAKIEFKSPRNSLEFNSGGRKAFLAPTVSQDTNYAAFAFGVNDRGDHDPNRDFVGLKIFNQPDSRQVEIVGDLTITRYEEQGIRTTSLRSLFKLIDDNFKMLKDFRVRYGEGSPGFYDIRL